MKEGEFLASFLLVFISYQMLEVILMHGEHKVRTSGSKTLVTSSKIIAKDDCNNVRITIILTSQNNETSSSDPTLTSCLYLDTSVA